MVTKWAWLVIVLAAAPVAAGVVDTVVDTTPTGAVADGTVGVGEYAGTVSGGGGEVENGKRERAR